MSLINSEVNLILTWCENCVISNASANQRTIFIITDKKLYVSVGTLSPHDNAKWLRQMKSGFTRTIKWNKYQSKTATQDAPNQYLEYLINIKFQGVNIVFVLAFSANDNKIVHLKYHLPTAKVEDYNVMINGKENRSTN